MRMRLRGFAAMVAVCWCIDSAPAQAGIAPDFPAVWRPFSASSVLRDSAAIARRAKVRLKAAEFAIARRSEGRVLGHGSPDLRFGNTAARVSGEVNHGLWHLGLDAVDDASPVVSNESYPSAIYADHALPRLRATLHGAFGFGARGTVGGEGTLELNGPAVDVGLPTADLRPVLTGWLRVRERRGESKPSLTPAVSVAMDHAPVFASGLPLALTFSSEMVDGGLPRSRAMLQLGWHGGEHGIGGANLDDNPFAPAWSPWVSLGYDRPLDRRTAAHFYASFAFLATFKQASR